MFAHLFRIRNGGDGIKSIGDIRANAAHALHKLVKEALFARNLDGLFINGNRQYLKLGTDENAVALEIVDAFAPLISIQGDLANCEFDLLNDVFGRFIADSFIDEKELGQYLTPPEVVRFMAKLAASSVTKEELQKFAGPVGDTSKLILDPSCGVGSFLTAVAREMAGRAVELDVARSKSAVGERILRNCCVGIDKSERMLKLAQLSFAMFGQQDPKLHLANALARTGHDGNLSNGLEEKARLILTNPPFGATFRENDIVKYRIANSWSRRLRGRVDSELLFVERYIDWLAPGGICWQSFQTAYSRTRIYLRIYDLGSPKRSACKMSFRYRQSPSQRQELPPRHLYSTLGRHRPHQSFTKHASPCVRQSVMRW